VKRPSLQPPIRGFTRLATMAMVALCVAAGASAQDEMPKDAGTAPARKNPPPAATPATPQPDDQSTAPPAGTMIDEAAAVLQALDKVTARVRRIAVDVGKDTAFGTLTVKLDACRKAPPEDTPQSAAFLEITDHNSNGTSRVVFSGWMFASSPALSAMDHPVYDISVVDCTSEAIAAAASSPRPKPPSSVPASPGH
jgi:hypothetical protein